MVFRVVAAILVVVVPVVVSKIQMSINSFQNKSLLISLFMIFAFSPFGGRIISIIPPDSFCPFIKLVIGPPVGGIFAIIPGTKIYDYRKIAVQVWTLGLAAGRVCQPAIPAIVIMGTSL